MGSIRFVCDATALMGPWGAQTEDVHVIGGFAIQEPRIPDLLARVRARKNELVGNPDVPVKWNLKDLKKALACYGLTDQAPKLLAQSEDLRSLLLAELKTAEPVLFASAICSYSNKRKTIHATKPSLTSFSFSNLLQRLGLWVKEHKPEAVRITLDWPESSARDPFVKEYLASWLPNGEAVSGNYCGALCSLRFEPGISFGVTLLDPLLQLSDLIVGATKSFLCHALGNGPADYGVQQFFSLLPHFHRSASGTVIGCGLVISPTSLKDKVQSALAAHSA